MIPMFITLSCLVLVFVIAMKFAGSHYDSQHEELPVAKSFACEICDANPDYSSTEMIDGKMAMHYYCSDHKPEQAEPLDFVDYEQVLGVVADMIQLYMSMKDDSPLSAMIILDEAMRIARHFGREVGSKDIGLVRAEFQWSEYTRGNVE